MAFCHRSQMFDQSLGSGQSKRCPKLSRYKLLSLALTILAFCVLTLVSVSGPQTIKTITRISVFVNIEGAALKGVNTNADKRVTTSQANHDLQHGDQLGSSQEDDLQKNLPSVIVIGARKAGTGALLRFINLHPWVVTSRSEPHYFDRSYWQGLDWYRSRMPPSLPHQVTMEKTPNYFVDRSVPERVHNFDSSIKLILIVRNPIDRAVSDYVQLKYKFYKHNTSGTYGSFEERALDKCTGRIIKSYDPIKRSLYSRHLDRWLTYFNKSQILILNGENLKVKPWEEMLKVERFLQLPPKIVRDHFVYNETKGFYCVQTSNAVTTTTTAAFQEAKRWSESCLGDTKGREHPKLRPEARKALQEFFAPFNERFFKKIGERFDWNR
ncbi:heparan sulfate glucosamine 3-O-sulfotransferase 5 [Biomphalaria glabrata]|nr:heparan sulfate glucosamine 3-O-sulfotransferase 5-like [Biomphalaria glabrata]